MLYVGSDGLLRGEPCWRGMNATLASTDRVDDGFFHHAAPTYSNGVPDWWEIASAALAAKPVGWDLPSQIRPSLTAPVQEVGMVRPSLTSPAAQNSQPLRSQPLNSQPNRTEVIRDPSSLIGQRGRPSLPVGLANPNLLSPQQDPRILGSAVKPAPPVPQVPRPTQSPAIGDLTGTIAPTSERV